MAIFTLFRFFIETCQLRNRSVIYSDSTTVGGGWMGIGGGLVLSTWGWKWTPLRPWFVRYRNPSFTVHDINHGKLLVLVYYWGHLVHTHTHARTHARTHTHTHTQTHTHTLRHTHTRRHTHTHTHTHTHYYDAAFYLMMVKNSEILTSWINKQMLIRANAQTLLSAGKHVCKTNEQRYSEY